MIGSERKLIGCRLWPGRWSGPDRSGAGCRVVREKLFVDGRRETPQRSHSAASRGFFILIGPNLFLWRLDVTFSRMYGFRRWLVSTAAPAPLQAQPKKGFFMVPNSFAENQGALTAAEQRLALIVIRRTNDGSVGLISDRLWEKWTGLGERQKEYAVSGLREKGLAIVGRGDTARYKFDWQKWQNYVKSAKPGERAKTAGVVAVTPKPGANVHPDCAGHGCAMMRACNPAPAAGSVVETSVSESGTLEQVKPASTVFLTSIAQNIAQTVGTVTETGWVLTLAALRGYFPMVALAFLARLVAIARAIFPAVSDAELAQAVQISYKKGQFSEGLFLYRVPEALKLLDRRRRQLSSSPPGASGAAGAPAPPDPRETLQRIGEQLDACKALSGAPYAREVRALGYGPVDDLLWLDDQLQAIEGRMVEYFSAGLPKQSAAAIKKNIDKRVAEIQGGQRSVMSPEQVDALRRRVHATELRAFFELPRLTMAFW